MWKISNYETVPLWRYKLHTPNFIYNGETFSQTFSKPTPDWSLSALFTLHYITQFQPFRFRTAGLLRLPVNRYSKCCQTFPDFLDSLTFKNQHTVRVSGGVCQWVHLHALHNAITAEYHQSSSVIWPTLLHFILVQSDIRKTSTWVKFTLPGHWPEFCFATSQ